jgi:hypothetical protein
VMIDVSATHIGVDLQQRWPVSVCCELLGFFSQELAPAQQNYNAFVC